MASAMSIGATKHTSGAGSSVTDRAVDSLDRERVMELLKHRLGGPGDARSSSYVLDEGT